LGRKPMDLAKRFWSKVDVSHPDECWLCNLKPLRDGYCQFSWRENGIVRRSPAHRMAWFLTYGAIPDDLIVRHRCPGGPNRACCNPAHLRIGTHADNMADRDVDGRTARGDSHGSRTHPEVQRGERNGNAKLTWEDVEMIRFAYGTGRFTQLEIATCYAISRKAVSSIICGHTWKGG
jgi:hypothetical protein